MKLLRNTYLCIPIALMVIFILFFNVRAEENKNKFAFVFNSSRNSNSAEYSLYGNHPLNQKVRLLHISRNQVCNAVTQRKGVFSDEVVSFPITILKTTTKCEPPEQYGVAYFEKLSDFQIVFSLPVNDPKIINTLDKTIRASRVLSNFRQPEQGFIAYDKEFPLEHFIPKVSEIIRSKKKIYLVSYENDQNHTYGPKFVVLGGKPHILTGWCSYSYVHSFILNEELYFESGSGCCECGITTMMLSKIYGNQLQLIHMDSSESD